MADLKISALPASTTPLAGTEVLPIVQSASTKKVSVDNLTVGRSVNVGSLGVNVAPTAVGAGVNIELEGGSTIYSRSSSGIPQLYISSNAVGTGFSATYKQNGYATQYITQGFDGSQIWATAPSGTAGAAITFTTRLTLANGGDFTINTGNLIQGTAAKGINFTANTPAAGMTSQLLNWYEEGTWTPAQGSGLTVVGAFSSSGTYTRIGRQVTVSGTVTGATSVAVAAAGIVTTNLPFTVVTAGHGNATNAAVNASAAVICTTTNVTSANAIAATGTITFSATYFV